MRVGQKRILSLLSVLGIMGFCSCASYVGKAGEPNYPLLEQIILEQTGFIKNNLTEKSALFVYASQDNLRNAEIAEQTAIKLVETAAPKIAVLERQNLDQALEELENQNSDLYDEKTTVRLGKMVGAQYMLVPESSVVKNVVAKLYHEEMKKSIYYQKMDLKIKLIELESGKICLALKNSYWEITPNQNINYNLPRSNRFSETGGRYWVNSARIIIKPNHPIVVRPLLQRKFRLPSVNSQDQKLKQQEEKRHLREQRKREKAQNQRESQEEKMNSQPQVKLKKKRKKQNESGY